MHRGFLPVGIRAGAIAALFLLVCAPAWGQYTSSFGYSFNNPVSATCNSLVWSNLNARATYRKLLGRHGYSDAQIEGMSTEQMLTALKGKSAARAQAPQEPSATRFVPGNKPLLFPDLAKSLVPDAETQKMLVQVFQAGMEGYAQEAKSAGMDHDIAGAMAYLIGSAYFVYNRGQQPNGDGLELLARALQQSLDTPAMAAIPNADKQRFYELMIGLATYLGGTYQQAVATNDSALADTMRSAAEGALRGFLKLDPAKLRINAGGFEILP